MKIIFGSIVTSGYGKIGGQFVKRIKGGHSLNNMMKTKSRSTLLNNKALGKLANIFTEWGKISETDRMGWIDIASYTPVTNPDGTTKNLSGREFFIKIQSQALPFNLPLVSPSNFLSEIGDCTAVVGPIDFSRREWGVTFSHTGKDTVFIVRIDSLRNGIVTEKFKKSMVLDFYEIDRDININIYDLLRTRYPIFNTGDYFQVSLTPANIHGWLGVPQVYKSVVIP
jgi:hypothetical protein